MGYSAALPDMDYTCLTASQTLEAIYTPYTSALSDGGALPELLVDGSFSSQARVTHTTQEVTWTDDNQVQHTGTACTVQVADPALDQVSYTVHYRLPEPRKRYTLWVLGDGGWTRQDYEMDGQYLLLPSQTGTVTFCVTQAPLPLWWILPAAGAVLLLAAAVLLLRRRKASRTRHTP